MVKTSEITKSVRSFNGLREALFDELDNLRSGNGDLGRVRAVCAVAGRINDTLHAEVKVRKMMGTDAGTTQSMRSLLT